MEDKEYWMKELIDHYGFSYVKASDITNHENAMLIIGYIRSAYLKGKADGTPSYNYSGGL